MITHYYEDGYYEDFTNSFDDFYGFYLKTDPVKRFVEMTAKIRESVESEEEYDEEEYENIINYISALFYSVKGTPKVFDFIRSYLNLDFDYVYDGLKLSFHIQRVDTTDEKRYTDCLKSFLQTLLYFNEEKLDIQISYINLKVEEEIDSDLSFGLLLYREYTCQSDDN
jgi:hypothetical protein